MHILFGKKKSFKEMPKPTQKLSPNFAQEILDLEEEVNLNCTVPSVTRLMSLYKQAIEQFEADPTQKHTNYQERMQKLMTKSNIIQILTQAASPAPSPRPPPLTSPKSLSLSFSRNLEISSPTAIQVFSPKSKPAPADLVVERNCNKVLKDHKTENIDLGKKIHENLKHQSDNLSQRLLSRKLAQTPRVRQRFTFEETNQCDISAGESKLFIVEEFEKNIENILEKFIEIKNNEKKRIEEKYREYFDEIDMIRGDVKDKLALELNRNMNKEIDEAVQVLESKREKELDQERKKLKKSSNLIF